MEIWNNIRIGIGLIVLILGVIIFLLEIIGIIKYKFLLNRMHAAGMGDTLGIFLILFGLMIINGLDFTTAKLALVVLFLWFSSPTSSHLISRLEAATDEELGRYVRIDIDQEELEK